MNADPKPARTPWLSWLVLRRPARVREGLARVATAGLVERVPSLWQVTLGVMRMMHRLLFRSDTIGLSTGHAIRPGWRARMMRNRALRLPFVLWEGSVVPLDLSGLLSGPERLARHLLGTHHDGLQFVYDLELLSCWPGELLALRDAARRVVEGEDRRSRWLRDLCVYEGYHEALLAAVEATLEGAEMVPMTCRHDADVSFAAWLDWCAAQPESPEAAWRAWRTGRLSFWPDRTDLEESVSGHSPS